MKINLIFLNATMKIKLILMRCKIPRAPMEMMLDL